MTKILIHAPTGIPRDLLVGYLSRCHSSLAPLSAALQQGDFETVRVFGHRLKGTGGAYGVPTLTEIGMAIERAALHKNSAELQNLVVALQAYLSQLEVAFE